GARRDALSPPTHTRSLPLAVSSGGTSSAAGTPQFRERSERIACIKCPVDGSLSVREPDRRSPAMRAMLIAAFVAAIVAQSPTGVVRGQTAADGVQVVRVTAKKYEFDPATITVVRGRRVRIEATATD